MDRPSRSIGRFALVNNQRGARSGGGRGVEGVGRREAEADDERLEGDGPALVVRTIGVLRDGVDQPLAERVPRQVELLDEGDGERKGPALPRGGEHELAVVARQRAVPSMNATSSGNALVTAVARRSSSRG